jgi:hypothetical protein
MTVTVDEYLAAVQRALDNAEAVKAGKIPVALTEAEKHAIKEGPY